MGQLVGQLTRIAGGTAIAVASGADKVAWCKEIGFDDGVAYREVDDLPAAIGRCCPGGVDVYFDNTAGPFSDGPCQGRERAARRSATRHPCPRRTETAIPRSGSTQTGARKTREWPRLKSPSKR